MGWQDRDYASANGYSRAIGGRSYRGLGHMTLTTKLIVVNVVVFVVGGFMRSQQSDPLFEWGAMYTPAVLHGQVWRLITSQYLHGSVWHLFFNMLGLHFLGRYLEQHWSRRKFLMFYTACGLAGNLFYLFVNMVGWLAPLPAIGASGCVLGVLGACAVLFPGIQLIIYFFPMRIRTAAALFLGLYALNLLQRGSNAGGDAAHLAGLLVGAGYAYWRRQGGGALPGVRRVKVKIIKPERPPGPWQRKLREEDHLGQQVDQVLAKIKQQGVASLTEGEKRILAEASRQQQAEEDRLGRTDRL